jgi:addiction module RelE/StbE family toxin
VKRTLLRSPAFSRDLRNWLKSHSQSAPDIQAKLDQLSENAAHPSLRTHKLRGNLTGCWACSAGYNLRIVFEYRSTKVLKRSSCWRWARTTKCIKTDLKYSLKRLRQIAIFEQNQRKEHRYGRVEHAV